MCEILFVNQIITRVNMHGNFDQLIDLTLHFYKKCYILFHVAQSVN